MTYEPKVSVAEDLAVVIVPKNELSDYNKEFRALRKRLEKNCKLYNKRRKGFAEKRSCRIYTTLVYYDRKYWLDLIPIILAFAVFAVGEILQLDYGSLDRLLYILAAYSKTVISRQKKQKLL